MALLVVLLVNLFVSNRAHQHEMTAHVTAIHAMADASLYAGHAVLGTSLAADPQNAESIAKAAGAWLPSGQDLQALVGVEKANMITNLRFSAAAGKLSIAYAIASTVLELFAVALCAYLALRVLLPQKRNAITDGGHGHE
ncbi:hypothetical protein WM40_26515 [Robbsia andropogonis]|uniref:Uncharacterized protein n=1 Tax=Robbsia andropogonis TaxID=28092 RepID=A0A0F5JU68_9BURK|nr:hypothetical protein WM40_26515 [Robbsia andropogonis]